MAPPGEKDLTFKIYGLDEMGGEVFADLFARKISILIKGLKDIDRIYNGGVRYDYTISGLAFGSTEIRIREKLMSTKVVRRQPAAEFLSYGSVASLARIPSDDAQEEMVRMLGKLCINAQKKFSYGMISNSHEGIIRIDPFLSRQVEKITQIVGGREKEKPKHFVGDAIGTFDGVIEAVDLKGDAPEARLILSAGGVPIECVLIGLDIEEVRRALGSRVLATGLAIYEGETGLPSRIEVRKVKTITGGNISKWRGAFVPAEMDDWMTE